ncbi:MAG TPA: hypothetical protein VFE62_07425 [Gemmataceae bacterium]|nr:hypothetical protein [Gemmataceae bacterium]
MSAIANSLPIDPSAIADVILFPVAEEFGLPPTDGVLPGSLSTTEVSIGGKTIVYELRPNCLEAATPQARVVYYVAHNTAAERDEFVVGPELLEAFTQNVFLYAVVATNFFNFLDSPAAFDASAAIVGHLAVDGQYSAALRMLGSDWRMALQDPEWWSRSLMGSWLGPPLRGRPARFAQPTPLGKGEL